MTIPARINRLSAINTMLTMLGQAPVNTVEGAVPPVVAIAKNMLDEMQREVMSEGWSFNTEADVVFHPDTSNGDRIAIPDDLIQADHKTLDITFRDGYFFDRTNKTFAFSGPLTLDVMRLVDFDGAPEPAKMYIAIKAGRALQRRIVGNLQLDQSLAQDEIHARTRLLQWEADQTDPSIMNTDIGFMVRGVRRSIYGNR